MSVFDELVLFRQRASQSGMSLIDAISIPGEWYFGGLDLAERNDHSAFTGWHWDGSSLKQHGQIVWPHIKYNRIKEELEKIYEEIPFHIIGYDATGNVGVGSFFGQTLPLEEVKLTMQTKLDAIRSFKLLMQNKLVQIKKDSELALQVLEQERIITDAGNITYRHPSGRHDDVFWSAIIGVYVAIPFLLNQCPPVIEIAERSFDFDADLEIDEIMHKLTHPWESWRDYD